MAIVTRLVKTNGKPVDDKTLSNLDSDIAHGTGRIWQLFSTKTMAIRTTVICINWYAKRTTHFLLFQTLSYSESARTPSDKNDNPQVD